MPQKIKGPKYLKATPCSHVHVSGRRCGQLVQKKKVGIYCGLHKGNECRECESMMEAFQPPKGWTYIP